MHGGAVDAEEDPIRDGRPSRVLRITIKTHLKTKKKQNKKPRSNRETSRSEPDLKNRKPKTKIKTKENI